MTTEGALSKLARYESLFELSSEINAAGEIERVGDLMARRLKYIADVFSWRYLSESIASAAGEGSTLIIDGYQGAATLNHVRPDRLPSFESNLWEKRKSCLLLG